MRQQLFYPQVSAQLLVDCGNTLGACVRWNTELERIFWTDVDEQLLYSASASGGALDAVALPDSLVSFSFDAQGLMICAFADGIYLFDLDTGVRKPLSGFESSLPLPRPNDGRCDRGSRFVVGGCDESSNQPTSSIRSYSKNEESILFCGLGCASCIAFSLSGRTMYFSDSTNAKIYQMPYDATAGGAGKPTTFVALNERHGAPISACVDAQDALWIVQRGGNGVQRFLRDATPDARVRVPAPNVTSCCFGGPGMDMLFVTTRRTQMTSRQLESYPNAGGLFVAKPGIRGVPEELFGHFDAVHATRGSITTATAGHPPVRVPMENP